MFINSRNRIGHILRSRNTVNIFTYSTRSNAFDASNNKR